MVLGAVAVLAMAVIAPVARAAMVTKIMYAQENTEYYEWTPSADGYLWVQMGWSGTAEYPYAEVDASIFGPGVYQFADLTPSSLWNGVNPESGSIQVTHGNTYYIGMQPRVGDLTYTLNARWAATQAGAPTGTNISCTRTSDNQTVTMPQSGMAYAADGEFYMPDVSGPSDWISQLQTWPGSSSGFFASWNDYVYELTDSSSFDVLSEEDDPTVFYPSQSTVRETVHPSGSATGPRAGKWYLLEPQIRPSYKVPNNLPVGTGQLPEPGGIPWTGTNSAPAWYTYAYPDSGVTTQATGYMFTPISTSAASKRSYCGDTSTGATITYTFYGRTTDTPRTDQFDWYYETSPYGCMAQVTIDGVVQPLVDQSSTAWAFQVKSSYSGLGNGPNGDGRHTVVIRNTGTRGQYNTSIVATLYHDAFVATQISAGPPVRDENNYGGSTAYQFCSIPTTLAHGNSYAGDTATNAAIACFFTGSEIDWYYETSPYGAIANVLIDGVPPASNATVDQSSSPGWVWQKEVSYTGLAPGVTHLILIYNSGQRGTSNTSVVATLYHDAFQYGTTWVEN
jgi:hypothetical protein